MFLYTKQLPYPVSVAHKDSDAATLIATSYSGLQGKCAMAMRYLQQRYQMPLDELKALLTDLACEELSHVELLGAMLYQLTQDEIDQQHWQTQLLRCPALPEAVPPAKALDSDIQAKLALIQTHQRLIANLNDTTLTQPLRFLLERDHVHIDRLVEAKQLLL